MVELVIDVVVIDDGDGAGRRGWPGGGGERPSGGSNNPAYEDTELEGEGGERASVVGSIDRKRSVWIPLDSTGQPRPNPLHPTSSKTGGEVVLLPQGLEGEGGGRKTVVDLEACMEKGEAESQPDNGYVTVFKLLYIPLLGVTLLLVLVLVQIVQNYAQWHNLHYAQHVAHQVAQYCESYAQ